MFRIFSSLIPLAILGGIIYVIVHAVQRRSHAVARPADGSAIRRLFQYAMLFAALVVGGIGLSGLLGRVLSTAAARSDTELATTLALTLVGVPVFVGLGRWAWRRLAGSADERDAVAWTLYLTAALVTALAVTAGSVINLLVDWIDGSGYDGELLATALVWGGVWVGHWYAWRVLAPTRGAELHLLVGAGIGLGILAVGAGTLIRRLVELGFDRDDVVGRVTGADLWEAAAIAGVGAAVWVWYWLVHGLKLDRSGPWLVYVMLYGVLGSLTAALVGAGRSLFLALEWLIGDPETTSALTHFRQLGPAVGALMVGLVGWRYHGIVVGDRADRSRTDVDRTYDSIVAGASLATVAAAIAILVVALFRLAAPAAAGGDESGGDVLLGAVTLLVVGGPLWAYTWRRMQRHARAGTEEAASTPRRAYLFTILGVSGAIAFGGLIRLLIVVFEAWLGERTGSLNEPLQWPVALLVTTGTIAAYHFVVARAERHLHEERRHRDVLLVWSGDGASAEIASMTHASIRVLHRTDQPQAPIDAAAVADAIDAAEGDRLVVLAGPEGIVVVPYE